MRASSERFKTSDRQRLAIAFALAAASGFARAQDKPAPPADASDLTLKRLELRGLEDTMGEAKAHALKLEAEVAAHAAIRQNLNDTLLEATRKLQDAEVSAARVEERLAVLAESERKLVKSLEDRRELIVEVLMALQRMGRRPPPALLARPQDILESLRASLALGDVLPQMRAEAHALQTDLGELVRLRDNVRLEKERLANEKTALAEQRGRLEPLIAARQEALAAARTALGTEAERAEKLARQATSLKDLIGRMEAESAAARMAAEAARKAEEERAAAQAKLSEEQRKKALAAPFKDAARLAPAVSFGDLKGKLPFPVSGAIVKPFGAPDGYGGKEKGVSMGAPAHGLVVAPCDGWIAFSGPYRSYGQLLIINAGGGYYVVLAGMSRTNVNVGQFVLAGEPVASMGDGAAQTAATIAIGAKQPILYVEFRKDGASIELKPMVGEV